MLSTVKIAFLILFLIGSLMICSSNLSFSNEKSLLDRDGKLWEFIEWSLDNQLFSGNPYDLVATVTFEHRGSQETRTTGMFYDGDGTWKFRFTGTRTGMWDFTTECDDPDLDNKTGTISIATNPGVLGFVTSFGNKWGRLGTDEAFVPQFVMYEDPKGYFDNPEKVDTAIQTFMVEHGFSGFHTTVQNSWFDIYHSRSDDIDAPNPDGRTFEAIELLISKVQAAGGIVHIWVWGDEERRLTQVKWGINGFEDKRLQRYIAARLGPLPGWTMGYGFDLFEWVTGDQLTEWHDYMQSHLGWQHYLGARSSTNSLSQLSEAMDYSSYEQHKPDYDTYVETIEARRSKPSFSEDRFRITESGGGMNYDMEEIRRGFWHSTMAGGVANIWGNKVGSSGDFSVPYPNPEQIKSWSLFFKSRFLKDMTRSNRLTDGVALKRPTNAHYVLYKEDASSIQLNLSEMAGSQSAVAIDTKLSYAEIDLGRLNPIDQVWNAPYKSDWAIAVGDFSTGALPDRVPPAPPIKIRVSPDL
ncbi:MAG: DUF5060 domain-containing protein [Bacteroidetes bacterium]|nr:DUF5060 domain-containing protein [Bacteroidota bacterium]